MTAPSSRQHCLRWSRSRIIAWFNTLGSAYPAENSWITAILFDHIILVLCQVGRRRLDIFPVTRQRNIAKLGNRSRNSCCEIPLQRLLFTFVSFLHFQYKAIISWADIFILDHEILHSFQIKGIHIIPQTQRDEHLRRHWFVAWSSGLSFRWWCDCFQSECDWVLESESL